MNCTSPATICKSTHAALIRTATTLRNRVDKTRKATEAQTAKIKARAALQAERHEAKIKEIKAKALAGVAAQARRVAALDTPDTCYLLKLLHAHELALLSMPIELPAGGSGENAPGGHWPTSDEVHPRALERAAC